MHKPRRLRCLAVPDWEGQKEAWELSNYGVFHCGLMFRQADVVVDLKDARYDRGFVVKLGTAKLLGKDLELWAFQEGNIPGSNYILLSREAGPGLVKTFDVLQRSCPKANTRRLRDNASLDIWSTNYCAINSRNELLTLSRRMLKRPPMGKLEWTDARAPEE